MSLPAIAELENMDFKQALKVLRVYIRDMTPINLKRDRDKIESAIAALRKRLPKQATKPAKPPAVKKPRAKPNPIVIDEKKYPALHWFTKAYKEQDKKYLARKKIGHKINKDVAQLRRKLREDYNKKFLEIFLSVADEKDLDEHKRIGNETILWKKEVAQYAEMRALYKKDLKLYKQKQKTYDERRKSRIIHIQENALNNIDRDYRMKLLSSTNVHFVNKRISWELLPKGELGLRELTSFAKENGISQQKDFEIERLNFAYQLRPESVYAGRNQFDGYFVFLFPKTAKVLLENPFYGNAAFIFHSDWKILSKLSRTELTTNYRGKVDRIIHSGPAYNWKQNIRQVLRLD